MERLVAENTRENGHSGNDEDSDEESGSGEDGEEESEEDEEDKFSDLIYESDSENEATNTSKHSKKGLLIEDKCLESTSKKQMSVEDRKAMMEKAAKELPYTFELPHKFEALEKLLKNRTAEYQAVILDRMIKCNHPKVEPANKEKMITLFAYLLQHINDTAATATGNNIDSTFNIIDRLCPALYDLSQLNGVETSQCFREVIKEKQLEYRNNPKVYPSLDTLIFFKIEADLYSVSDFRHFIVSPTAIFISQILSRCNVNNRADIASGLFLVTTILDYTRQSKRFLPSAINFLTGVIYLSIPKRPIQNSKVIPPFKSTGASSSLLALTEDDKAKVKKCTEEILTSVDLVRTNIDVSFKLRALNTALRLATDLFTSLKENSGARFLAEPIESLLEKIDTDAYPEFVNVSLQKCQKIINSINDQNLNYIVAVASKPKALRQLEPKFERIYDDKRNRKPGSKEKAIREGMIRKIRKETKGAVREIRRDNAFLSKIKFKQQMHGYVLSCFMLTLQYTNKFLLTNKLIGILFILLAMLNDEKKFVESFQKHQFNRVNLMQWIEKRNIYKNVKHYLTLIFFLFNIIQIS